MTIKTKGGEVKQIFATGAQRGLDENKPMWHRIPIYLLDVAQQAYGGSPLIVDSDDPPITGTVPFEESDSSMIPELMINRLSGLYWRGAQKYSRDNWKRGISLYRTYGSMFRHMIQWAAGDTSEDHLAAIIWNATTLMWTENAIGGGKLPKELADYGPMAEDERYNGNSNNLR